MKNNDKKNVINKEEIAENWCFVCKDGGALRICDYKQCLKSYHPGCVEKDDSFLESESHWSCPWHTCFSCSRRSPYLHCYTCTNAICRQCLHDVEFLRVKEDKGFCESCLKLALLIEENKEYDSDGDLVDFTDRETCEGLYMEYYMIIKEEEGFEFKDLVKMKRKHQSGSGSEEFDDEEYDQVEISDNDGVTYEKKCKRTRKEERSKRQKSAAQKHMKSNEDYFVSWASKSLLEFLTSIGRSTSEKLSQLDVTSIVNEYIKENNLFHPEKRKTVLCDARLKSLFKRRTVNRYRIYDLLEAHFSENQDESEEDELGYDSENNNAGNPDACKRKRKLDAEEKSHKKELEKNVPQSDFAAIVVDNIKLVYLKRSVLYELLKQPESFAEKVTGSFVRIKSNPYDPSSSNSHQLIQVKGTKTVSVCENNMEMILLSSDIPEEINISQLSDDDFSEGECQVLRQKLLAGRLKRPMVEELQQKAKLLHKEITMHRIRKEVNLLEKLMDRANEKGWRREFYEYLLKKKRLQDPVEQSRLLENVPTVIPDSLEVHPDSEDVLSDMKTDESSPKSTARCKSTVSSGDRDNHTLEEDRTGHILSPAIEKVVAGRVADSNRKGKRPSKLPSEENRKNTEVCLMDKEEWTCSKGKHQKQETGESRKASTKVIHLLSDDEDASDD